jgi:hypothetical protein
MKNAVFWDVTPCCSCKNRHFGGLFRPLHQEDQNLLVIQMMEALCSTETSVLTTATGLNIREDGILNSHRREKFKSYLRRQFNKFIKLIIYERFACSCMFHSICHINANGLTITIRPPSKYTDHVPACLSV